MSIQTAKRLETVEEYYFSKKLREVRELVASGKPVLNMAIGSPDLDPPKEVVQAIQEAVLVDGAHKYQSYQGLPELREAIADFYSAKYQVSLNPKDEILPLMGSKEGIMHISLAYLNEGDEVLVPNPGYPTYSAVTNLVGAKPIFYDLVENNGWEPDFHSLSKRDLSKVKIMWVNYPNMPTGASGDVELFKKMIDFAKKHSILLVKDNPYSFILNDSPTSILSIEGAKEVALELNSLSKTFNMAGWRVGMVSGSSDKIEAILKVKSNMDSGMFQGIQRGAIAALRISNGWYDKMNAIYKERRILIWELVDLLGCSYDKTAKGMFVWAKLPEGTDAVEFIDTILYENDIFIAPGDIFGSNGKGYIRFSLCVTKENIKEAIGRLHKTELPLATKSMINQNCN
ncbi:aspartate/methionine/tyrosine aminotransferase [Aquimarina sp. EL_43]|uniref:pyridoxal phosphate-dependent aminotransferase n=1 Tax=unclassified Aquimarina TaxID=2627091 RepID=UPI0018C9B68E|nr:MULTISPECIES: aminotransferase class I/II-fold pyridoxal phosphate-dependent enzyme [unclassified Aquimarina]MBG6131355.1 aspartate/methionine/tyrosine aminotransferase [Aquimarina sp. EL_35]MBG6151762.1 aspartate/methionine/tyrosine aminotransferase [Aquimarina sp. EL_32]MBG6169692.1 aspartate/methionine/tyrosine aminotransferase [Aquimarina sp. EL_43]